MSGTNGKIERDLMNKALAYSSNIALAQQGIIDMSDDKTYAQFQLDMDKNIVKLIQVASKEDLFERVIDLARRLQTPKCFDLAIKICRNRRQDALVEKIFNIQQMRVNEKYDQQQKMLRSTVAEEQEQAQPLSEAVQAHNDTNISATNLNDDEVKPFYTAAKKGTTSISSSESPPLMLNKFRLAAEKRTVKSNKRTITGSLTGGKYRSSNSRNENEPSTKKQKQGQKILLPRVEGRQKSQKRWCIYNFKCHEVTISI